MRKTAGLLLSLAAAVCCWTPSARAQLSLFAVPAGVEAPVGPTYDLGTVAVGDRSDTLFRLKNTSAQLIYLTYLSLDGAGFSTLNRPLLPAPVPAGGNLDFTIRFQPDNPGSSFSATLQLNQSPPEISTILFSRAVPGLTPMLNNQMLASGQILDFGSVKAASSSTLQLALVNPNQATPLTVGAIALSGSLAFQLTRDPQGSTVQGLGSVALDITFSPTASGQQQGSLTIGSLSFPLQGVGLLPALPKPSIQTTATAASAQQGTLSVNLDAASQASATGTVTLAFQPSTTGVNDDPTVTFSDGTRTATFSVADGATAGQFSAGSTLAFQTGTTAGSLVFTATLGANTTQSTITIPAADIGIDAAVGVRNVVCVPADSYCTPTNVELQINGWDNTRTTSQIVFHFFDASGNSIAPGDITVDGSQPFTQYFATSAMGGVFGLHARFPVTGDANQVAAAEVRITNSMGTTSAQRIVF